MSTSFNTANMTLRQVFAPGLSYTVPRFQRDYSWTQDEWDDLWRDVEDVGQDGGEPAHYMGYLVLQTRDGRTFDVIDGQQRLTTLSLLVLAILKTLEGFAEAGIEPEANRKRLDQFRTSFIGDLDPVSLVARPKLVLNRNNDAFYKDYIVPLRAYTAASRLSVSEKALYNGFRWFLERVRSHLEPTRSGAECARFLEAISDRLFFTVITVADELNAFKVFETLNARGVRLSPTDLLKNYLFSVVHRESRHASEIDALERRWQVLVNRLGAESFPDFLRAHWNSRNKLVRHTELFKTIRAESPDREAVFALVTRLEDDVHTYAALPYPEDPLWTQEQSQLVAELRMFAVRQHWPLLLAARRKFDEQGVTKILRACVAITFRYNVIGGLHTNAQETTFNEVARAVSSGKADTPSAAIAALAPIYLGDPAFRAAFAEKSLVTTAPRNKKVARYILVCLERHLTGTSHDANSAAYTVEHVLPQNPGPEWDRFNERYAEDSVYRLGNMVLLEANANRDIGNRPYLEKRPFLASSRFAVTRRLAEENDEWTPDRLAAHQQWMANQATSIWRVPQLA